MTKKTVTGLLDTIGLQPNDWEIETISEQYIPGMGLGATDHAKRWAADGHRFEINRQLENVIGASKKKKGRPGKTEVLKTSNLRAFHMWLELREMPTAFRVAHTNRELIAWIKARDDMPPGASKLWPKSQNLERSLSEGRTFWGIGDDWRSQHCEDYWRQLAEK